MRPKILKLLILFLLLSAVVTPFALISDTSANPSWLTGWDYRTQITVTNANADYQTKLTVYYGSGTDGNNTVYCSSHCNADFSDLRFTGSDEVTLLDYWVESYTASTSAVVWVQDDATPSTTCYMYYGNAGASSLSNGTTTFLFFDDFSGDLSQWSGDIAYASINSGILSLVSTTSIDHKIYSAAQSGDIAVRTRANLNYHKASFVGLALSNVTHYALVFTFDSGYYNYFQTSDDTPVTISNTDLDGGNYHIYDVCRVLTGTDTIRGYKDGVQLGSDSTSHVPTDGLRDLIRAYSGATTYVDWTLIRKCFSTEPTWSFGAEEEAVAPTVTTLAANNIDNTTATVNGEVTDIGDTEIIERGFVWDTATQSEPDEDTAPIDSDYANCWTEEGSFGATTFNHGVTGLPTGTIIYFRAAAENGDSKWGYGDELTFLTKPAAPTSVVATDGDYTGRVTVTWTKPSGNVTGYKIYEGSNLLDTLGDVAAYNDTGAPAPTITPGTAIATDGSSTSYITVSLTGESANNGTLRTYKVRAYNDSGDSADSNTDTGYRGVGALTHQWYRSSGDADDDYSTLAGAVAAPYDDATAPQGTITPGSATASNGTSPLHVTLNVTGESVSDGAGRYYLCELSADGATSQNSTSDRGYRAVGSPTYQWMRSSADADADYSSIEGATTDSYEDTAAPAPTITGGNATASDGASYTYVTLTAINETSNNGDGRYFLCTVTADGADAQNTTTDRGYRGTDTLSYQWMRSAADSDADYSDIVGGITNPYNDTGGTASPDGRYYKCSVNMTGADSQNTTTDRGYMLATIAPIVVTHNATDITGSSATLNGEITDTGHDNADTRGFEWGTSIGNYTWSWNQTGDYGIGAFSHGITSLGSNQTYYYRAFAINDAGTGYGDEVTFNTTPYTVPVVTSSVATNITLHTAIAYGNVTAIGGQNVTTRGFDWGYETGNYTTSWNETGSWDVGAFSYTLSGLTLGATVYWLAWAVNPEGRGNSTELSFEVGELPRAPRNFAIKHGILGIYVMTWDIGYKADITIIIGNEDNYPSSPTDGYVIYSGNATTCTLEGVNADLGACYFRAWSYNDYGYSLDYGEADIGDPLGLPAIIFIAGIAGFALWKKGWLRILLSICLIIFGVATIAYDIKVAAPLIGLGVILFVMATMRQISIARQGGEQ
jgi:hypothetical protein